MIKRVLVVSMVGLSLVGCVNNDTLSGMFIPLLKRNKYRMSAMAPSLTYVRYRFRAVMIPTLSVQLAVLFLVVSWEYCWCGTGRSLATAAGAVAGGVAGQGVQSAMNKTQGVELEIRKDDGNTIMVVQKQGNTRFSPGQRVVLASNGSQVTVSPR
ncbi:outer membrane lipoprotein [Escherichia coli]|nr:outer membrane lipoprotein [Escherichia coli]